MTYINLNLWLTIFILLSVKTWSTGHMESTYSWRHPPTHNASIIRVSCLVDISSFWYLSLINNRSIIFRGLFSRWRVYWYIHGRYPFTPFTLWLRCTLTRFRCLLSPWVLRVFLIVEPLIPRLARLIRTIAPASFITSLIWLITFSFRVFSHRRSRFLLLLYMRVDLVWSQQKGIWFVIDNEDFSGWDNELSNKFINWLTPVRFDVERLS